MADVAAAPIHVNPENPPQQIAIDPLVVRRILTLADCQIKK